MSLARLKCLTLALSAVSGAALGWATGPHRASAAWAILSIVGLGVASLPNGPSPTGRLGRRIATHGVRGLVFGACANAIVLSSLPTVVARFTSLPTPLGWLALVLLATAQGLAWGASCALCTYLRSIGVRPPFAFATGAFAGTFFPAVFWWTPALALSGWLPLVQLADTVGERGVVALGFLTMGFVIDGGLRLLRNASSKGFASLLAGAILACGIVIHGLVRLDDIRLRDMSAPRVRVALLNPMTGAETRWNATHAASILNNLRGLTVASEAHDVDLTIWPEAAFPYVVDASDERCDLGSEAILANGVHGPVLTGVIARKTSNEATNAAVICGRDGMVSPLAEKRHLVPFGEAIPFADEFPWLRKLFLRGAAIVPGTTSMVLRHGAMAAGILNCVEDTLPDAGRDAAADSPNLLVNITNDAWFSSGSTTETHFRAAGLRAIELRLDLVRAVNFGPPGWIDATGTVRTRGDGTDAQIVIATPALSAHGPTHFAAHGERTMTLAIFVMLLGETTRALATRTTRRLKQEGRDR